jgi:hypothetical protein
MSNMSLDVYTFDFNPSDCGPIEASRVASYAKTYGGVCFYSWGSRIVGKEILLSWTFMPSDQYASLKSLETADVEIIWDPQDGSNATYNVQILSFSGSYHLDFDGEWRKDCELTLLIMSEVT